MVKAGLMRDRVTFQRLTEGAVDDYGNVYSGWSNLTTRAADLREQKGRERINAGVAPLDLAAIGSLTFAKPDRDLFPCLALAEAAMQADGDAPCVLNAANEIAVDAFLNQRMGFTDIAKVVEQTMNTFDFFEPDTLAAVQESDARARRTALSMVKKIEL